MSAPTRERYDAYWARSAPPPTTDPLAASRRALLWSFVDRLEGHVASLLDCGVGHGTTIAEAQARGLHATGIDIARGALERAAAVAPGTTLIEASVERLPWPVEAAAFDVVVSFEVIEHLLEPRALVTGAFDALRPGGALAITTPYHGLVKNVALAVSGFDRHFAVEGDHVRFFSDASLARLVEEVGFRVEATRHLGRVRPLWANTFMWARKP